MPAIKESQWNTVEVYRWDDLKEQLWSDFRLALMETETEQVVQGVAVEHSGAENATETVMNAQGVRVEYSSTIARTITEMIVSIVVSNRDYKTEMLKYLPLYERKSAIFNEILRADDREFRSIEQSLAVMDRNLFINTAIESLPLYERDLNIKSEIKLSYDQRREQVSAITRAVFDQTTEETIKNVAAAYGNGEVDISDTNVAGVYQIRFIGIGIPNNMKGLEQAIDIIIPAHLGIEYAFTFNVWESVKGKSWNTAAGMTWDELRSI